MDPEFSGTDERRTVTITVTGEGRVVAVLLSENATRDLSHRALESAVCAAFAAARGAAAAAGASR